MADDKFKFVKRDPSVRGPEVIRATKSCFQALRARGYIREEEQVAREDPPLGTIYGFEDDPEESCEEEVIPEPLASFEEEDRPLTLQERCKVFQGRLIYAGFTPRIAKLATRILTSNLRTTQEQLAIFGINERNHKTVVEQLDGLVDW